jgi:Tol biopolymer transport system component
MKQHRYLNMVLATLGAMLLLIHLAAGRQDPQQEALLQKAIQIETVDGDLNAAIKLYRQIVENPGENRTVAAKALLQIGKCYEKLGSLEARKAYETLLKEYADQSDIATEARTRLAALAKPAGEDGIKIRRVWAGYEGDNSYYVSPTPDGRSLVYVDWDSGGNVAIRELASGQSRLITTSANDPDHFALHPILSPDGKQIAFMWFNANNKTYDLRVVEIDGGKPRILYADGNYEVYPDSWSPDGRQIAVRRYGEATEIALITVADGSIRVLKSLEELVWARVCYSGDDRYLVYDFPSDKDFGRYDISMLAVDGSGEVPLVHHPANDRLLGWIPGTRDLLFRSDRSGTYDLYILQVSNNGPEGAPESIKRAIGEIDTVGFTNDGSFYFSIFTGAGSLLTAPFDPKSGKIEFEKAKTYLGNNITPLWSHDGNSMAFATEQHNPAGPGHISRHLSIRNMKTGDIQETATHLIINQLYCWAPDASAIIVRGGNTESQYGIYQVELPGGKTNRLYELAAGDTAGAIWTADRKAIIHSRDGVLVIHNLETKEEIELFRQSGGDFVLSVSPDGENLALGISGKLVTIPVSGGMVQELTTLPGPGNHSWALPANLVWTPDSKYLLFPVEERQNPEILYRISAEGGKPEKLWESKNGISGMSIHPDGRQIALSTYTKANEIWVMENLLRQLP